MPRARLRGNVERARQLRAKMSLPEPRLWQLFRRQTIVHIRRQHPVGHFILDFYCAAAKVCIEIDGIAHDMGDRPMRDVARDHWLSEQGIEVLRIPASEVLKSAEAVADAIVASCQRRSAHRGMST